ncbi:hypothetical protein LshimejAT787_0110620 [Lyophyllum shimeji]|uniref:Uncharacterized protein n=1 Tax=Lyophyllum shimeji TaxID=47721 RepID=A0A9P3UIB7_LYOSH|nr:hypothetical protein LshimejAT787_0110620 [Lyophyllum shimeji]
MKGGRRHKQVTTTVFNHAPALQSGTRLASFICFFAPHCSALCHDSRFNLPRSSAAIATFVIELCSSLEKSSNIGDGEDLQSVPALHFRSQFNALIDASH